MSHLQEDKKKKQREKNKRTWLRFLEAKQLDENVHIGAPEHEVKHDKQTGKTQQEMLQARMVAIRSNLTSRVRHSDDMWNRFAGTSDGGGRGR
jgi:hypothetical protein